MPTKSNAAHEQYSGFVLTFEPERTQWLAERLHSEMEIKESFSALDSEFERRELVLLVLNKAPLSISAIALMERMHGSGGSGKLKMRMTNMVVFDDKVAESELGSNELSAEVCTPETLKRANNDIWESLIAKLRKLRPVTANSIDQLMSLREAERHIFGQSERVARLNEQRDSLGLALDIAQLDRSHVMKMMKIEKKDTANSILELLDTIPIQERSLLEHDARIFQQLLGQQSSHSALFTDDGSERSVRVHVVDQTDLETVLGVDLIIYCTCYENFLLLQYKKMVKDESGWVYHISPTSNLHKQLESMAKFRTAVASINTSSPPTLWSYRLNDEPFYFKFCEQLRPEARDDSLIPGITLPEPHLREFLTLPEAKGPKGGLSIGHQNCPRYLNNTEFIQLARVGWIGAGKQSVMLLHKVLEANRKGGRAAMLAVIDTPKVKSASGRGRLR